MRSKLMCALKVTLGIAQKITRKIALAMTLGAVLSSGYASAGTLDDVRKKEFVLCGVSSGIEGFSNVNEAGEWSGIDVDLCHAIAAAVFGDSSKVKFKSLLSHERFNALRAGDIDVLTRNTTWTMTRDTSMGLNFAAVNYYDGQGFVVRKSLNIHSALELSGATICASAGSTSELNLADYFSSHGMDHEIITFEKSKDAFQAYLAGRCDSYSTDKSIIYARISNVEKPDEHLILPQVISKEPLGPVVRQGDDEWFNLVKWSHFAMVDAESHGITMANVEEMLKSENPAIRRLLGLEGSFGEGLGLSADWVVKLIKAVGNYGESYERNFGAQSKLKIPRGLNALWQEGGLVYSPPIR